MKTNFKLDTKQLEKALRTREVGKYSYRTPVEKIIRKGQVLPPESVLNLTTLPKQVRNGFIRALIAGGWTTNALSDATGLTKQMISYIKLRGSVTELEIFGSQLRVPQVPRSIPAPREPFTVPLPETLARLLELKPLAELVRSNSPKYREEAEEYTALLWEANSKEKVTIYRLAKLLGVTHTAISSRLVRYGYTETVLGETKMYFPIKEENRARKTINISAPHNTAQ